MANALELLHRGELVGVFPEGLRGVGKTVMLNAFEAIAEEEGCQTALIEIDPDKPLAQQLAPQLQHILHRLDRMKKAGADLQKAPTGLGLIGMRERAEMLGGSWRVTTGPGEGFRIEACIPVNPPTFAAATP